jgi:hypothetical protein
MILAHAAPPFAARRLSGNTDEKTDWRRKWERLKLYGSTISLQAAVHLGRMPWALTKEEEEEERMVAPFRAENCHYSPVHHSLIGLSNGNILRSL